MDPTFDILTSVSKAFSHATRLNILAILSRYEACVCHLTAIIGERQAHISQHLRVLKDAGLVADRRDGIMIYYRLADARAGVIVSLLKEIAQQENAGLCFRPIPDSPVPGCSCPRCTASETCCGRVASESRMTVSEVEA